MKTITRHNIESLTEKHVAKILKKVAKYYPDCVLTCYAPCSENEADVKIECKKVNGESFYRYYVATNDGVDELKGNPQYLQQTLNASITIHDVDTVLLQKIVNSATNRNYGMKGTIFFENGVATIFFSIFYPTWIY